MEATLTSTCNQWSLPLRFIFLFFIAGFCWLLDSRFDNNLSLAVVLTLSLPHYAFALVYRYRAKGLSGRQAGFYALALAVLFTGTALLPIEAYIGVVAIYFVVHHLLDEDFLSDVRSSQRVWLRILPVILIYASYYTCLLTGLSFRWSWAAGYASLVLTAAWLLSLLLARHKWQLLDYYHLAIYGLSYSFVYAGLALHQKALFEPLHFLVLCHVMNWYVHQTLKLHFSQRNAKAFMKEVVYANLLSVALFIAYYGHKDSLGYAGYLIGLFYQPLYFYVWTLFHFLTSVRRSDFQVTL